MEQTRLAPLRPRVRPSWFVATVSEVRPETPTAVRLVLDVPGWPGSEAGSHLDLRLTAPDGYQATRSYSIASSETGGTIVLAVDELPDGEVSPFLVRELRVGDQLEVHGPLGSFFLWRPGQSQHPVQLIAGGSGVVPLYAMVASHEAASDPVPFRLLYSVRTPEGIEADAAEARKQGADIVVVSMHWGIEYKPVSAEQKKYADALLRSGQVDWIIGNHPHIVQPCQKIDGRYVSYALGNLFSGQQAAYLPGTADGAYASVTFTRDAGGKISQSMTYQPTYQDQKTRVVQLATPSQNPASYAKTTATMGAFGCDAKPAS